MSAERQANQMRLQAALVMGLIAKPKFGEVTSYDPGTYSVKVMLQPEGIETGWLPIAVLQAGAGWGIYASPQNGDQAVVLFQEGDREAGWCAGFLPNEVDQPPNVPQGEIHVLHKDGAKLKFLTGGVVELDASAGLNITAPTTITGTLHVTQDVTMDGKLTVSGIIKSLTDVLAQAISLFSHKHGGVQTGGGISAGPQ